MSTHDTLHGALLEFARRERQDRIYNAAHAAALEAGESIERAHELAHRAVDAAYRERAQESVPRPSDTSASADAGGPRDQ